MKSNDPMLLADGTLLCRMYHAGKVGISRHLRFSPGVTILSASSVRMLTFIEMKHSRPPDLKSSSNVSLPFSWITGPATDTSFFITLYIEN